MCVSKEGLQSLVIGEEEPHWLSLLSLTSVLGSMVCTSTSGECCDSLRPFEWMALCMATRERDRKREREGASLGIRTDGLLMESKQSDVQMNFWNMV